MKAKELEHLIVHLGEITSGIVNLQEPDGGYSAVNPDRTVNPDVVSAHHALELVAELSPSHFTSLIESVSGWLLNGQQDQTATPFAVDALARFGKRDKATEKALRQRLVSRQLKDGSFDIYTAYFHGGNFFSTLWASKIMLNFSPVVFRAPISAALDYLIHQLDIAAADRAQHAFLFLLLLKARRGRRDVALIERLAKSLRSWLRQAPRATDPLTLVGQLYVADDLAVYAETHPSPALLGELRRLVADLFELQQEPKSIPARFVASHQSVSVQLRSRACILALRVLRLSGHEDVHRPVLAHMHRHDRIVHYDCLQKDSLLKNIIHRYGRMLTKFERFNDDLAKLKDSAPFNRTIFLSMPFTKSHDLEWLTRGIRLVCEQHDFKAVRADDPDRTKLAPTLWENMVINMLSCRFAIAVYVDGGKLSSTAEEERKIFPNPNVALEFGFFMSRGEEVMILKDTSSGLHANIDGFLREEIDLKQFTSFKSGDATTPPTDAELMAIVGPALDPWLRRIKATVDAEEKPAGQ